MKCKTRIGAAIAMCAMFAGCGSLEESDPKPRLDAVSTPGTDYASTLVGTRKRLDFRLRNSDSGLPKVKPLEDIVPTVSGAGLTLSHNCPGTLEEGEECFLSVYYLPTAAGTLTGELRVTSNAATVALPLSGGAVTELDPPSGVLAFVGTPDGSFGSVSVGQTRTLIYAVRNIGNADDAISVVGPTGSGWSVSDDCPDTLAVDSSCNISVVFAPTERGLSVPTPLIVNDAYGADYGGLVLNLTGTGS
ncbi:choice-of-anchor D domain-containing protein [uncultured Piscinibacter sp.]|uniref:choice-of-anchor D domain-containing protein n=1 Tax=uncultured Piscinibacter sp. TaxID=1131835 RepID=UPI0026097E6D|nr:choice-of-anchor D domain-containing protein [uncultured Piscinibacter sp.]